MQDAGTNMGRALRLALLKLPVALGGGGAVLVATHHLGDPVAPWAGPVGVFAMILLFTLDPVERLWSGHRHPSPWARGTLSGLGAAFLLAALSGPVEGVWARVALVAASLPFFSPSNRIEARG